jgi:hypothetical protein
LTGHPRHIHTELGVSHVVFDKLISTLCSMGLHSSHRVSLEEQLSIFLYASVTGLSVRYLGERFQRSNDTISWWVNLKTKKHIFSLYLSYFRLILIFLSSPPVYTAHVCLPTVDGPCPSEILNNPKFWPFFQDSTGALNGTHISASPSAFIHMTFWNRKGFISQNCLFACNFNMQFIYLLCGWEGSATDALVYQDAQMHDLTIPKGKYYLADAGYPSSQGLLIPYRGVRYHLEEWGHAGVRLVRYTITVPYLF